MKSSPAPYHASKLPLSAAELSSQLAESNLISRPRIAMAGPVFFLCFIAMSPALSAMGLKGVLLLAVAVAVIALNGRLQFGVLQRTVYAYGAFYLAIAGVVSTYWSSTTPLMFAALYVLTIVAVANLRMTEIDTVIRYATLLLAILIVLAWIGMSYFMAGGGPIVGIVNPDGRDNLLYLTTFSNVVEGAYIRPSGIYDEPGAFSFFICALCVLREITGRSRNVTIALLIGGLVTLSIAHMIYLLLHLASFMLKINNRKSIAAAVFGALMVGGLLSIGPVQGMLREVIIERALKYQSGEIGNTREQAILNIYAGLSTDTVLYGFGRECVTRSPQCADDMGGAFGENPLTPIVYGGLVLAWPYYLTIVALLIYGAGAASRWFLAGFALLLMQRPYVLEFPYSGTVFLLIMTIVYARQNRSELQRSATIEARSDR